MTREKAIQIIDSLFPADADYDKTREIGERLLAQAKMEVEGWKNEPTPVLLRYAELCEAEENRQSQHALRDPFPQRR